MNPLLSNRKGVMYLVGAFIGIMIAAIILYSVTIDTVGDAINDSTYINGSAKTLANLVNLFLVIGLIFGILGVTGITR